MGTPDTLDALVTRLVLVCLLCAGALAAAGCGGEATSGRGEPVTVNVTSDYGARHVATFTIRHPRAKRTQRALLAAHASVIAGPSGVRSIDGVTGPWRLYVNGVATGPGAGVYGGERVWWDSRPAGAARHIPVVVGGFPEPFVLGVGGHRVPVIIQCARPDAHPCQVVSDRLAAAGVPASPALLGQPAGHDILRILVGPWSAVGRDGVAAQLRQGPRASGVYAVPGSAGASIGLLDARGRTTRTLRAGAGLIAAVSYPGQQPTWVVTGTDAAGTLAAARTLNRHTLAQRYAVAVGGGRVVPLPTGD